MIDGRRNALAIEGEQREDRLDGARGRERMPDHRFVGRNRDILGLLAHHGGHCKAFHLVIFRGAGAVGVDIVDVVRFKTGIGDRVSEATDDWLAIRTGASSVKRIRQFAATFDNSKNCRSARLRMFVALEYQGASSFGHYEAIAIFRKWLRGAFRWIVLSRQGGEQGEANKALRVDRTVGCHAQRYVGLAAPDRLESELNCARARRAGG